MFHKKGIFMNSWQKKEQNNIRGLRLALSKKEETQSESKEKSG